MQAILTAIWSRYNAGNSFKTALTGGLHLEQAPQGTAMPYATYFLVSGRPEYYFRGHFEIALIQFDVYAATNAVRQDLYDKLILLYDDCRPAVTGYTSMIMERTGQQMLRDGDQGQVYRAIIEYSFRVDKSS